MNAEPNARPSLTVPPIPAVLLSIVSVQGGAAVAKILFPALGPAGMSGMRITLSAAVLFAVLRPSLARLTRAQWVAVIPYGLTLGAMNLSFYLALERIPLGLGVTLEFMGPLALAVFGSRWALDFLWALLAGAGIVLLAPWRGGAESLDLLGVVLALGAGAFWAGYIVLGGRVSRVFDGGQGVAVGMLFATLVVLPVALAGGVVSRLTPPLFAAGFAVALLSSALPFTLEMMALRVLPSRTFGILMSLEPAAAAIAGLLFLREQLSALQWLAVLFVSAASAGSALTASRVPRPVET
ncbi:DMT family transporter [Vitiosangium sp. GDMCC 1.1324]|uniref:EamA family transporter n=1 Tax=Vitiosangium sp. (strain GDMCC 1.1324) TaxID=2138576 RepID=UPI000D37ABB3|nr:DMT family transporter [Vitiosangium sp. GDMCC 1.1324]PTL78456.1 EamA family transporter [Vitiosangium sp. GDMCC 1.1324]